MQQLQIAFEPKVPGQTEAFDGILKLIYIQMPGSGRGPESNHAFEQAHCLNRLASKVWEPAGALLGRNIFSRRA